MKKYTIIIVFLIFLIKINYIFADTDICETNAWFALYQCRVQKSCEPYKKSSAWEGSSYKPLVITTEYIEANGNYWIEEVKAEYRRNMNSIYSCWILKSQKKSIKLLEDLVKMEKSWKLRDKMNKWIQSRLSKINLSFQTLKCKNYWGNDEVYNKKTVLDQTTYELCRYTNYLEYLKYYYSDLKNSTQWGESKKSFWITELINKHTSIQSEINNEMEHTFKVFPVVFNAYSEYENNFPIHVLLELIRDDFVTFRDKLYETISPINQLAYKISNAMSIH